MEIKFGELLLDNHFATNANHVFNIELHFKTNGINKMLTAIITQPICLTVVCPLYE